MSSADIREPEERYRDLVVARLGEFFDHRTPWNRGLWQVGTILALREVLEYEDSVAGGQPVEGLTYVCQSAVTMCTGDPGLGGEHLLALLTRSMRVESRGLGSQASTTLTNLTGRCQNGYLLRWADAFRRPLCERPGVELAARRVAAHLLDHGFSGDHLHGWVTKAANAAAEQGTQLLHNLMAEADAMCARAPSTYKVLAPFANTPRRAEEAQHASFRYLDQAQTEAWLAGNVTSRPRQRPAGAFVLTVTARDPWAAVERANDMLARTAAQLALGVAQTSALHLTGDA